MYRMMFKKTNFVKGIMFDPFPFNFPYCKNTMFDGLNEPWSYGINYVNPPFSRTAFVLRWAIV